MKVKSKALLPYLVPKVGVVCGSGVMVVVCGVWYGVWYGVWGQ